MNLLKRNLTFLSMLLAFSFITAVSFSACQTEEESEDTEINEGDTTQMNHMDEEHEEGDHPAGDHPAGEHPSGDNDTTE